MKKIISIFAVIVILVTSLFILTGCDKENGEQLDSKSKKFSFTEMDATVEFEAPEGYTLVKKGDEGVDYEFKTSNPYALIGNEEFVLEMGVQRYLYQTNTYYKEKYGEIKPSFPTYKEYMSSDLRSTTEGKTEKEFKVGVKEAIGLCNTKTYAKIYADFDEINTNYSFEIDVVPTEEPTSSNKTRELLDNKDLENLLSTFKFIK